MGTEALIKNGFHHLFMTHHGLLMGNKTLKLHNNNDQA